MWNKLTRDLRVQGLLLLIVIVTARFWLTSRYPSLDTKSMMSGSVSLADGLSFDAWIPHDMADSVLRDILVTFANWVHTNEQGMIFGLTLAALVMSLLPLLRSELDRFLSRRVSATFAGALFGTPLGVCVNCAAPIGYGLYRRGARLEAALAAMISSPTMNVVVLSMAFTLFPVYIVAIKIAAALFVILVLVPLLVSRFPDEALTREGLEEIDAGPATGMATADFHTERNPLAAGRWLVLTVLRQGWLIVWQVVPIMLLAGLLGSAAVVLVPWDAVVGWLPQQFSVTSILMMFALSAFGLFLPVPIAFDVILAASLRGAGLSVQYIAILLFVLGSFSVYSFMVLLRAKAHKVAISLALSMVAVGVATGVVTKVVDDLYAEKTQAPLFDELRAGDAVTDEEMPEGLSGGVYEDRFNPNVRETPERLRQALAGSREARHQTAQNYATAQDVQAPTLAWQKLAGNPRVQALALAQRGPDAGRFQVQPIGPLGLHHHFKPLVYNFINEFPDSNGVSGGDFNDDGWFDLLFATPNGVYVYANTGGKFQLHSRLSGDNPLISFDAGAAAFIDLDNDGREDIIFSEHDSGLWIAYNRGDRFAEPVKLPASDHRFAKALAFYDLDGNGYLEFFAGHVSSMLGLRPSHEASQNLLYKRQGDDYAVTGITEPFGETLSLALGHVDDDGRLDLWVGNDFDEPDMFYELEGGEFRLAPRGKIEQSTRWTMSIDAADIDNDLDMEVYIGQTTWNPSSPPFKIEQGRNVIAGRCAKFEGPYCSLSKALAETRKAVKRTDATLCEALDATLRLDCIATVYFRNLKSSIGGDVDKNEIRAKAELLRPNYPKLYKNFVDMLEFDPITRAESNKRFAGLVPQRRGINVLLVPDASGNFRNRSVEYGVEIGGWTWNARFADVDGDEWQDLYVANGWTPAELETTNVLYRNNRGRRFVNVSAAIGLLDFEPTIAYTYIDFDNDGDLDIVNYSQIGRVSLIRNDLHRNHVIQFELRDSQGNRAGIGSRLVIRYGGDEDKRQIREIKMSGGHLSFDPKIAHFGLGQWDRVEAVEIAWSTGEREIVEGPFAAGHRYRISR